MSNLRVIVTIFCVLYFFLLTVNCESKIRPSVEGRQPIEHSHDDDPPPPRHHRHLPLNPPDHDGRKVDGSYLDQNQQLERIFIDGRPTESVVQKSATYLKLSCAVQDGVNISGSVTWFKDRMIINSDQPRLVLSNMTMVLAVEDTTVDDSGIYSCRVRVKTRPRSQTTFEKRFDVMIYDDKLTAPVIRVDLPGNHTVLRGANLTLRCEIINKEEAGGSWVLMWMRHFPNSTFKLLDEKGNRLYDILQNCGVTRYCTDVIRTDQMKHYPLLDPEEITLTNLQESGWFSCAVNNLKGNDLSSGYIQVVDELPVDPLLLEERQTRSRLLTASIGICVVVISICLLVSIVSVVYFRRSKFYKRRAKLEEKQKIEANMISQRLITITKRVLVSMEQPTPDDPVDTDHHGDQAREGVNPSDVILVPHIRIEKQLLTSAVSVGHEDEDYPFEEGEEAVDYSFQVDPEWEFDRKQLDLGEVLGEGAFGRVVAATAKGLGGCPYPQAVAVKMLKSNHSDDDVRDLAYELYFLKKVGKHKNIISLLGECTQPIGRPLYVIVEYARHGNLKNYLLRHRPSGYQSGYSDFHDSDSGYLTPSNQLPDLTYLQLHDLLNMGLQVAEGMSFLSKQRFVHRDLAARNILVCDNQVYKIADFGMARTVLQKDFYFKMTGGRVPLKWMAPESLYDRMYTTKSDVWSYGILLWEIMSYGDDPYQGINNSVFQEILRMGSRLQRPVGCPDTVHNLMQATWQLEPESRPTFADIEQTLKDLYSKFRPHTYLQLEADTSSYVSPNYLTGSGTLCFPIPLPASPPPTPIDLT